MTPSRKHSVILLGLLAVLVLLPAVVLPLGGWRAFQRWRAERMVRAAQAFMKAGNARRAEVAVRRAFQLDPENLAADRFMAGQTLVLGSPQSVEWWQRVVQTAGASAADRLSLADAALHFGEVGVAERALTGLDEASRKSAAYHSLEGKIAAEQWKLDEAGAHFAEALRLEPENPGYQFDDASVRLQSKDAGTRAAARATLQRLKEQPPWHAAARRALLQDDLARQDWAAGRPDGADLTSDDTATFPDRLLYLTVLLHSGGGKFDAFLTRLEEMAAKKTGDASALAGWMASNGQTARAVAWAGALPPDILGDARVQEALAACFLKEKDWGALERLIQRGNWKEREPLRHTLLARCGREQGKRDEADTEWSLACSTAAKQMGAIRELLSLLASWGWTDERRRLLWIDANSPAVPEATWALGQLYDDCRAAGDTAGLQRIASRMVELYPQDDAAKNNLAVFSMLIDEQRQGRAYELASALYKKDPSRPEWVTTFAFALYRQGHTEEAVHVMGTLPEVQLEDPVRAAYYGVLLVANGEREKAAKFLDRSKAAALLPEESELVAKARQGQN